jgi:hypothetical protein
MPSSSTSLFERLNKIDCRDHVEKKGQFDYLSWTWAWTTLKEQCPDATFTKRIFENGLPYVKDDQGYAYVSVSVTAEGQSHTEVYAVAEGPKPIKNPNSFQINRAIQRCLVKAIAYHGLGLYIYAGETMPEEVKEEEIKATEEQATVNRALQTFAKAIELIGNGTDPDKMKIWWDEKIVAAAKAASVLESYTSNPAIAPKWQELNHTYVQKLDALTNPEEKKIA